jgi:hypothetical protein
MNRNPRRDSLHPPAQRSPTVLHARGPSWTDVTLAGLAFPLRSSRTRGLRWLPTFTGHAVLVLGLGCTVYDEDLLTGAAKMEGDGGSASAGAGGTAARLTSSVPRGGTMTTTQPSMGGSPSTTTGTSTSTGPSCAGKLHEGLCWYLGPDGASCTYTCALRGGVDALTAEWVGTQSQGGSVEECATLLQLFGITEPPTAAYRTDGRGVGCMTYGGNPFWHAAPSFDPDDSMPDVRQICACMR